MLDNRRPFAFFLEKGRWLLAPTIKKSTLIKIMSQINLRMAEIYTYKYPFKIRLGSNNNYCSE
jgi:hypothetical protein